jgi:hypothetical protein
LLQSCGELAVQSTPGEQTIAAALAGEWRGTWQSDLTGASGEIVLRVQDFAGEPVVSMVLDNPCVTPDEYDLELSLGTLSMQADGVSVVQGTLASAERIVGAFGCALDHGTWFADRVGDLPELVDLGGSWSGLVALPGGLSQSVAVTLLQRVEGGRLALEASFEAPGLWPTPVPMSGVVTFGVEGFDLLLTSPAELQPFFAFSGMGERQPLAIPAGQLFVLGPGGGFGLQLFVALAPN